jgi:hypothetical protein
VATHAWLGPMTDSGLLHSGWVDIAESRLWLVVSAADAEEVQQRLDNLPIVSNRQVTFTTTEVKALRFG